MTATTKLTSLEQLKQLEFKAPPPLSTKVEGKEKKERAKQTYIRCEPVYVRKLVSKTSQNETGRLVGVTGATINVGLKQNTTAQSIELAARGVYKETYEKPEPQRTPLSKQERLLVLRLSTNDLKAMEDWLTSNNVSFSVLS